MNLAIIGTQWGDEGKGKIVDLLAKGFDYIVRFQGGNNAGHTVVVGKDKFPLHLVPSGVLHKNKICCLGAGVVANPAVLFEEIENIKTKTQNSFAQIYIDENVNLIMPYHVLRDSLTGGAIGTTGRGIGPCYSDSIARRGIKFSDFQNIRNFKDKIYEETKYNRMIINAQVKFYNLSSEQIAKLNLLENLNEEKVFKKYKELLEKILKNKNVHIKRVGEILFKNQEKSNILFEGAQATLLDIYHGTYPFVTSSHPTVGGAITGTGFYPKNLKTMGVIKAYTTRVGEGPFPTELKDKTGNLIREKGQEFGTTTGRPRRCGWLDLPIILYAKRVNGLSYLALTKLDILTGFEKIKVAVSYKIGEKSTDVFTVNPEELGKAKPVYQTLPGWNQDISKAKKFSDLPKNAQKYVRFIEEKTGLPIKYIGIGPSRSQIIKL